MTQKIPVLQTGNWRLLSTLLASVNKSFTSLNFPSKYKEFFVSHWWSYKCLNVIHASRNGVSYEIERTVPLFLEKTLNYFEYYSAAWIPPHNSVTPAGLEETCVKSAAQVRLGPGFWQCLRSGQNVRIFGSGSKWENFKKDNEKKYATHIFSVNLMWHH